MQGMFHHYSTKCLRQLEPQARTDCGLHSQNVRTGRRSLFDQHYLYKIGYNTYRLEPYIRRRDARICFHCSFCNLQKSDEINQIQTHYF
jgi:hypothetical protein